MGLLQSSINNLLGMAAVASKLSPEAQERSETKMEERRTKKAIKTMTAADKAIRDYPGLYNENIQAEIAQKRVEAEKSLFYKNPNEETLQSYSEGVRALEDIYDVDMFASQKAERELARSQKNARNSINYRNWKETGGSAIGYILAGGRTGIAAGEAERIKNITPEGEQKDGDKE